MYPEEGSFWSDGWGGVDVGVLVGFMVDVGEVVAFAEELIVGVGVGVAVDCRVGLGAGVGVGVSVGVGLGVGVGWRFGSSQYMTF